MACIDCQEREPEPGRDRCVQCEEDNLWVMFNNVANSLPPPPLLVAQATLPKPPDRVGESL